MKNILLGFECRCVVFFVVSMLFNPYQVFLAKYVHYENNSNVLLSVPSYSELTISPEGCTTELLRLLTKET